MRSRSTAAIRHARAEPLGGASPRQPEGQPDTSPEAVARLLRTAARLGFVEAQTALGQILLDGQGVGRDPQEAVRWFAIAAGAGHPPAINMLGRCRELGWGTAIDHAAAATCYRQAAASGLDWAQYNYANMLLRGRGVPRDRSQALAYYRRAALQGHAKSMNMIGRFIEEGWETLPNRAAAAAWYAKAAAGGDFRGQYNLASLLALQGDVSQAEAWLRRAMETATDEFLVLMAQRLARSPEPRLRRVGAAAASRAGHLAAGHAPDRTIPDTGRRLR